MLGMGYCGLFLLIPSPQTPNVTAELAGNFALIFLAMEKLGANLHRFRQRTIEDHWSKQQLVISGKKKRPWLRPKRNERGVSAGIVSGISVSPNSVLWKLVTFLPAIQSKGCRQSFCNPFDKIRSLELPSALDIRAGLKCNAGWIRKHIFFSTSSMGLIDHVDVDLQIQKSQDAFWAQRYWQYPLTKAVFYIFSGLALASALAFHVS